MALSEQQLFYLYVIVAIGLLALLCKGKYGGEGFCQCRKGGIPNPSIVNREQLQMDVSNCKYPSHFQGVL